VAQKKLQVDSQFNELDLDHDGIVSDNEMKAAELQHDLRKQRAQRRMATAALVGMGVFTLAMFFVDIERVNALSDISNLMYISGAGIVSAYMGSAAIMHGKK
jgi:cytochrome bd-type quinol oxidase subunit 2